MNQKWTTISLSCVSFLFTLNKIQLMTTVIKLFALFAIVAGLVSTPVAFADHSEVTISAAQGSGSPGCEASSEGCYIPKEATVDVGGKVIFSNTDNAAHTFSAGNPIDGPSGIFDSGLVPPGSSYEWMPTAAGEFSYFCMVHPWMVGLIVVQAENGEHTSEEMNMTGNGNHDSVEMQATATGMLSDGTRVSVWSSVPTAGEEMEISVEFIDAKYVTHDMTVTQNGNSVLDTSAHLHEGKLMHETSMLASSDPVEITITFQGYGLNDPKTGPIGEKVVFSNIVPEFGTIAMMILAVSIISIVAITAKTQVIPRF